MSGEELLAWQKFFTLEPFGCDVEDQRAGVIAAVISEPHRDRKERPEPFQASDFFKRRPAEREEPVRRAYRPGDVLRTVEAMSLALGGQDKRRQRPNYESRRG